MRSIASRISVMSGEGALSVFARAKELEGQGRSIIHLELGEPDFHPGQSVIDSAVRALAEGKDVVITMLPTSAIVADVLHGPDGVLAGLTRGGLVVEMKGLWIVFGSKALDLRLVHGVRRAREALAHLQILEEISVAGRLRALFHCRFLRVTCIMIVIALSCVNAAKELRRDVVPDRPQP